MPSPDPRPRVGRLAPSPTGGLHLGNARTFLLAWLAARASGGRVLMRVEDLDATRARPEAVAGALDDLRWLGLDWDEGPDVGGPRGPYVQSQRLAGYGQSLERLKASGRVYPCTCTRADIQRAASAPHASEEGPTYPGTCSGRVAAEAEGLERAGRSFAWRFRVPAGPVAWDDGVRGPMAGEPARVGGDFVVARSEGTISYQLAVVHDDAAMGVSQVVRGDDLVTSTPRQILLDRALGWEPPGFAHAPLVVGPDGRRLAKRDGSVKLATLRAQGADPRRVVGWLARSCGWADRVEPSWPRDWLGRLDLRALPAGPVVLTPGDVAAMVAGPPDLPLSS